MDSNHKNALGGVAVIAAFLILFAVMKQDKVYDIPGDEVVTIVAPAIPKPYVVDSYESSVIAVQSWDHLEADNVPLLEIEPVDDVVYDYILDEQLTELPPLQG
jgi:hypothetical protein